MLNFNKLIVRFKLTPRRENRAKSSTRILVRNNGLLGGFENVYSAICMCQYRAVDFFCPADFWFFAEGAPLRLSGTPPFSPAKIQIISVRISFLSKKI